MFKIFIFSTITGGTNPHLCNDTADIVKQCDLVKNLSVINTDAIFADGVTIGAQCSIDKCTIGANTVLCDRTTVGKKVVIGSNVVLKNNVEVMTEAQIGDGTVINHDTVIACGVSIGSDCVIGAKNEIGSKVIIKNFVTTGSRKIFNENTVIGVGSKIM